MEKILVCDDDGIVLNDLSKRVTVDGDLFKAEIVFDLIG